DDGDAPADIRRKESLSHLVCRFLACGILVRSRRRSWDLLAARRRGRNGRAAHEGGAGHVTSRKRMVAGREVVPVQRDKRGGCFAVDIFDPGQESHRVRRRTVQGPGERRHFPRRSLGRVSVDRDGHCTVVRAAHSAGRDEVAEYEVSNQHHLPAVVARRQEPVLHSGPHTVRDGQHHDVADLRLQQPEAAAASSLRGRWADHDQELRPDSRRPVACRCRREKCRFGSGAHTAAAGGAELARRAEATPVCEVRTMTHTILRSRHRVPALVFVAAILARGAPRAQEPSIDKRLEGCDAYMAQVLKDWNVPGIGVGIVVKDKLVFSKGYGYRDYGKKIPFTADTTQPIASNTKLFTAIAAGLLVDEGKLDWDKPIRQYVPGIKFY